jgi:hypothetical protein
MGENDLFRIPVVPLVSMMSAGCVVFGSSKLCVYGPAVESFNDDKRIVLFLYSLDILTGRQDGSRTKKFNKALKS